MVLLGCFGVGCGSMVWLDEMGHLNLRGTMQGICTSKGKILSDLKFCALVCGGNDCLLLNEDGEVYAFGDNTYGYLGVSEKLVKKPMKVEGIPRIVFMENYERGYFLLDELGGVWVCGHVADVIGLEHNQYKFKKLSDLPPMITIAAMSHQNALFVDGNGLLWSSGRRVGFNLWTPEDIRYYGPIRVELELPIIQGVAVTTSGPFLLDTSQQLWHITNDEIINVSERDLLPPFKFIIAFSHSPFALDEEECGRICSCWIIKLIDDMMHWN